MKESVLAGYALLIERYSLNVLPNWHTSSISLQGMRHSTVRDGRTMSVYPQSYWPGDGTMDHLEFALKYDTVNLSILSALFWAMVESDEITAWIASNPIGKYSRRAWFLYEFLTGRQLPLSDLDQGNYIDLLEPDRYYTIPAGHRIPRQRICNNLLGGKAFCPIIRRTEKLAAMESVDLRGQCEKIVAFYPPERLQQALSYLYNKETQASFEIEQIKPDASRTERFIELLKMAEYQDFCNKPLLIDVQNRIVDSQFRDVDYRTNQNYVGQSISCQKQLVHYVSPKPSDLPALMEGLLSAHREMGNNAIPAVIHAAAISYGFVFMHPFEDGNGRIHRFLIHNILFLRNVVPQGLMFPVSAVMLKNPALYDQSLGAFSKPLMQLIEYDLDDLGRVTVLGESGHLYRYIDMTPQAEALYDFIQATIEHELLEELTFLMNYDKTKQAIQEIVDMPDRLIDLFIKLCLQNNGRLSAKKRKSRFELLTDYELNEMERAVKEMF
jgi:hypothetical protein